MTESVTVTVHDEPRPLRPRARGRCQPDSDRIRMMIVTALPGAGLLIMWGDLVPVVELFRVYR